MHLDTNSDITDSTKQGLSCNKCNFITKYKPQMTSHMKRNHEVGLEIKRKKKTYIKKTQNKGLIPSIFISKIIETKDESGLVQWKCVDCGFVRQRVGVVMYHVKYKHMDQNLPC